MSQNSGHPVSVVAICLNEERCIRRCLESVSWADEIVLIDGGSTDQTLKIALDPSAGWAKKIRVIENPWPGFRTQRNLALKSAKYDWVLTIDADEACSPELANKIRTILSKPTPENRYFKIRRQEYFLGKEIHYGIWNPSYQDRFFHREGIQYINEVHEYPPYPSTPTRIHEPLLHDPTFDIDRFLSKMNKYTSIEAQMKVQAGFRTNPVRLMFSFFAMFWKNYFYYRAYRDGMHGFIISLLEGVSREVRHIKIWRYGREQDLRKG